MPSKIEVKIEDNFLNQTQFNELQSFIMGKMITWHYQPIIDNVRLDGLNEDIEDKDKFQFIHVFYGSYIPISNTIEKLNPIVTKLNPMSIWRIKANLLTKTSNINENSFHVDMGRIFKEGIEVDTEGYPKILEHSTTSIFYMNTNNGYTKFEDGTKVESVANRLISFPSNMKHKGTSCTDEKTRVVINFNYFK